MRIYDLAVIGGGASGMTAAITALEEGLSVVVYEGNDKVGRKLLATGNGKCNFSHQPISLSAYHSDNPEMVSHVLEHFDTEKIVSFFDSIGMLSKEKNGYLYPLSEQAATVLDLLRIRLKEKGAILRCNCGPLQIRQESNGTYQIIAQGQKDAFHAAILATGSRAGGFLQDQKMNPYEAAQKLGLTISPLYPSLTKGICKETFFKSLAGVRAEAEVALYTAGRQSTVQATFLQKETGEVQFTAQGLSGIVFFQLSGLAAEYLAHGKRVFAKVCFLPQLPPQKIEGFLAERLQRLPERTVEEFFTGLWNKKVMAVLCHQAGLVLTEKVQNYSYRQLQKVLTLSAELTTEILSIAPIQDAQVCRGGVSLQDVTQDLEAVKAPGVFLCGELLNVDGICGGYNLHWAWSSGIFAGRSAARYCRSRKENRVKS